MSQNTFYETKFTHFLLFVWAVDSLASGSIFPSSWFCIFAKSESPVDFTPYGIWGPLPKNLSRNACTILTASWFSFVSFVLFLLMLSEIWIYNWCQSVFPHFLKWPKLGKVKMYKLQLSDCLGRQYDKSANTGFTFYPQSKNYIWRLLRWVLTQANLWDLVLLLFSFKSFSPSKDAIMRGSMFKWFEKSCAKKWEDALGGRKWREVASLNSCRSRTRGESLGNTLTLLAVCM